VVCGNQKFQQLVSEFKDIHWIGMHGHLFLLHCEECILLRCDAMWSVTSGTKISGEHPPNNNTYLPNCIPSHPSSQQSSSSLPWQSQISHFQFWSCTLFSKHMKKISRKMGRLKIQMVGKYQTPEYSLKLYACHLYGMNCRST